jgi:hypothetical protein
VHVVHEAVEVIAPLLADRQFREERVDQEGLAAADAAPEVEAAQRRAGPRQELEAAREQGAARQYPTPQVFETRKGGALGRIERMALRRK